MLKLVFDTHVWLDWLVFDDPAVAPLREAVAAQKALVVIDTACEAELERVLAYPLGRHGIDAARQQACLAQCRGIAVRVESTLAAEERARLPQCRDPDDQKFLELALAARADLVLTKDRALLELARHRVRPVPFRILHPRLCVAGLDGLVCPPQS